MPINVNISLFKKNKKIHENYITTHPKIQVHSTYFLFYSYFMETI